VSTDTWAVLTLEDRTDAEAAHAVLSGRRIFALRTQEAAGWRLWIRWSEEPDSALVRGYFERLLSGLKFRIACEGQTLAPLHGGGSTVGPDGKPASFAGVPGNSLAPLARRFLCREEAHGGPAPS